MYHRVIGEKYDSRDPSQAGLAVEQDSFDRQMEYLKRHYDVIPLERLVRCLRGEGRLPDKALAITFDDGWRDNYDFAFPVLSRHKLPATIYLSSSHIGGTDLLWFHEVGMMLKQSLIDPIGLAEIERNVDEISGPREKPMLSGKPEGTELIEKLKRLKPTDRERIVDQMRKKIGSGVQSGEDRRWMLDWDEVKQMSACGISFGSHGVTHTVMTELEAAEVRAELIESKELLEKHLGSAVRSFAYPNGDYGLEEMALVEESGYDNACAAGRWMHDGEVVSLFALPRTGVHEGMTAGIGGRFSEAIFACKLAGLLVRRGC
jgi:peptidoglycan/xylan/chitin deacetylase (PgdA/CDA1 family)